MTDQDLIAEFIRTVSQSDGRTTTEVLLISWPHPHEPESNWLTTGELPSGASPEEIDRQVRKLLKDRKYFKVCQECGERNPTGWMHNSKICQSCAERNHGVVY